MWCPRCRADLPRGLLTCPACGEVPVERPAASGRDRLLRSGELGTEVGAFAEAADGQAALDLLAASGLPAELVVRSPAGGARLLYCVAVRPADAAQAGEILGLASVFICRLCGASLPSGETVCAQCGEPTG